MTTKKTRLDDFDFDDLDFDSLEQGAEGGHDSHRGDGPIRKLSRSFGEGAKEAFTNPSILRRFVSSALPEGYGVALNTLSDVADGGLELYNAAAKELRPALPAMRRAAARLAESSKTPLPQSIKRRLESFAKGGEVPPPQRPSQEEQESAVIAQELGGIFAASIQHQSALHAQDQVERKIREKVQDRFSMASLKTLHAIRGASERLVAYQDQVTLKYQQKSLELQYRQLFATREMLALQKRNSQRDEEFMNALLRNTAMSDAAKAEAEQKENNRLVNRLRNRFQQGIVEHFNNFTAKLQENILQSIRSAVGGFSEGIQAVDDVNSQLNDVAEFGLDKTEFIGRSIGRFAGKEALRLAAGPLRRMSGRNKKLTGFGARLNYLFQNIPEHVTRWSRRPTDGESIWSDLLMLAKEMVPRKGLDNSLGESHVFTADAPAAFNMQTRRSINEIIPGYLMRIHHELLKIRSKNNDIEPVTYNMVRGSFSTVKEAEADQLRQVFNPRMVSMAREGIDRFIEKNIVKGAPISKRAREALRRQLMLNTARGELFDPEDFLRDDNPNFTELKGSQLKEVQELIRAHYAGLDGDDYAIARDRANTDFKNLRYLIPDVREAMHGWKELGLKQTFVDRGLVDSVNGVDTINFSRVMDYMLKTAEAERPDVAQHRRTVFEKFENYIRDRLNADSEKIADVFMEGRDSPVLQAALLEAGRYRDAVTGKILTSLDDIRGPVEDVSGQVVLTAEQVAQGLYTKSGRLLREAKAAALKFLRRNRTKFEPMRKVMNSARERLQRLRSGLQEQTQNVHDIYTEGGTTAIVEASKLAAGEYRDAITQQVVTTVDEIKGPLVDRHGRTVLSAADFVKGLYDEKGRKLKGLMQRARTHVTKLYEQHIAPRTRTPDGLFNPVQGEASGGGVNVSDMGGQLSMLTQLNAQQVELLTGIHEILATRNFLVAPGSGGGLEEAQQKSWMQRVKDMPKRLKLALQNAPRKGWDLLGRGLASLPRGGWWALRKTASYAKKVYSLTGSTLAAPLKVLRFARNKAGDIYVKGRREPALYTVKMQEGKYRDVKTGKPVTSIRDINGAVEEILENGQTRIVLTQEEFSEGLFDTRGRRLVKGLAKTVFGFLRGAVGMYANVAMIPILAVNRAARLAQSGLRALFRQPDVYVRTDLSKPRLRGILLEQGRYWSVRSQKIIYRHQDIDGAIRETDESGRELISEEEFKEGLVDYRGKPLGSLAERMGGALVGAAGFALRQAGRLARGYAKVMGGALGFGKDVFLWLTNRVGGIFNPKFYTRTTNKTNQLLEAIHDMLDQRLPNNGTGRAGSWQSQLKARQEAARARKARLDKDRVDNPLAGLWGKLKNGGKGLFGLFGGEEDSEDDGGDTTVIAGGLGGDDGEDGKDRKKKAGGKKGRMRGLWDKIKGKAKKLPKGKMGLLAGLATSLGLSSVSDALGGTVGNVLEAGSWALTLKSLLGGGAAATAGGAAAGGALTAGAAGAGSVAAGGALATLGLPILVGAAIVGAAGYGIYKAYKKYKYGTFEPLRSYRMSQYGIDYREAKHVEKIVEFEQMVEPFVKGIGGQLDISSEAMKMEDVYRHFDIDDGWFSDNAEERKLFDLWFARRFKPVFISWRQAVNTHKPGLSLNEADSTLTAEQKLKVLDTARSIPKVVYEITAGPFGSSTIPMDRIEDVYRQARGALENEQKGGRTGGFRKFMTVAAGLVPVPFLGDYMAKQFDDAYGKYVADKSDGPAKPATPSKTTAAGALGGVIKGGSQLKGVSLNGSISALDAIRYRTYGLLEMETDKVRALAALETDAARQITFGENGEGTFIGDTQAMFEGYSPMFGAGANKRADWIEWFQNRFLPTLIAFGSAVRAFQKSGNFLDMAKALKPDQAVEVGTATQGAQRQVLLLKVSVWQVTTSPWPDYRLNTDPRTVHDNLMALKEAAKKRLLSEEKSAKAGGKNAKGTASTQGADQAERAQQRGGFMNRVKDWMMNTAAGKAVQETYQTAASAVARTYDQVQRGVSGMVDTASSIVGLPVNVGPPPKITGTAKEREQLLIKEAQRHGITDPAELAMLLAQVAHESGNFKHLIESMKYRPERAKAMFPERFRDAADAAAVLAQGEAAFAERIYGGRKDLGNTQPGDGYRFRGRGLLQLTGRYNYTQFAKWSGIDVVSNPDLVATDPRVAALSAIHFWKKNVQGKVPVTDLYAVTKRVNGGENGIEDRRQLFGQYLQSIRGKLAGVEATTTTANGPEGGLGAPAKSVTGPAKSTVEPAGNSVKSTGPVAPTAKSTGPATPTTETSGISRSSPTAGAPTAPVLDEYATRDQKARAMLARAPGYASTLDSGANSTIRTPFASQPIPDITRPAPLATDLAVAQQRRAVAETAVTIETQSQMAQADVQRQLQSVNKLLDQQLTVQRTMERHLGTIAETLRGMKGSALGAVEGKVESSESKLARALRPSREAPKTEEQPTVPVSVRRRVS